MIAEGLTARVIVLFVIVALGQVGGSIMLGYTAAFTRPGWSIACALTYAVSLYCLAVLLRGGAPLSMLMPLLAAVVPIAAMLLAGPLLGEAISWPRMGLLTLACVIVAAASAV
ncbi:MAG: hypothetical protein R3D89_07705 [Sphingomonadaceae bacterium]